MTHTLSIADQAVIAVERAIAELRAGRPVWVEETLIVAAEYTQEPALAEMPEAVTRLLKLAQLLPQAVRCPQDEGEWLMVSAAQIVAYHAAQAATLQQVSEASLPLKYTKDARIIVFRPRYGWVEHLAVVIGSPERQETPPPLVRVHSSCLTGDLLGSLRCDCGDQLHLALEAIAQEGAGVLCYLNQEGRGIGIGNKIHAYPLQDEGKDTLEANEHLGFAGDERDFAVAGAMLKALGLSRIRLLTNNPKKLGELSAYGVEVADRVPLIATPHDHNRDYLNTKAEKFGHLLS